MGWHLPFGRSAHAPSVAATQRDSAARIAPYGPRPREWAQLSPIATVSRKHDLTADDRFADGLSARPRDFFLQALGHEVSLEAPQGLIAAVEPEAPPRTADALGMPLVSQQPTTRRSPLQRLMTSAWTSGPATPSADGTHVDEAVVPAAESDGASAQRSVATITPAPVPIGVQRSAAAIESLPPHRASLVTAASSTWSDVPRGPSIDSVRRLDGGSKDGAQLLPPATFDVVSHGDPQPAARSSVVQRATLGQSRRLGLGPPLSPRVSRDPSPDAPGATGSTAASQQTSDVAPADTLVVSRRVDASAARSSAETPIGDPADLRGARPHPVEHALALDGVAHTAGSIAGESGVAIPHMLQRAVSTTPSRSPTTPTSPMSNQRAIELPMPLTPVRSYVAQRDTAGEVETAGASEPLGGPADSPPTKPVVEAGLEPYATPAAMPAQLSAEVTPEIATTLSGDTNVQRTPAASTQSASRPLLGTSTAIRVSSTSSPLHPGGASTVGAVVAQRAPGSTDVTAAAHDRFLPNAGAAWSSAEPHPPDAAAVDDGDTGSRGTSLIGFPAMTDATRSSPLVQRSATAAPNRLVPMIGARGVATAPSPISQRPASLELPAAATPSAMPAPWAMTTVVQRMPDGASDPAAAAVWSSSWTAPGDTSTSSLVAQRGAEPASPAPSDSGSPASSEAGGAHAAPAAHGGDADALAHEMYQRIRSELRMELLLDRERAGLVTDLR